MTTFVFMLSNCIGLSAAIMFTSPILSQVMSVELIIPSTSTSSVLNDSSFKLSPCCFSRVARMLLADIICHPHTLPILFVVGGLCLQINDSPPSSSKRSFHWMSVSAQRFVLTKLVGTIITLDNPDTYFAADETP